MQKIASHFKNLTMFGKASKLVIQMVQTGSVKPGSNDHFFATLEAAMSLLASCTDVSVQADYHALFSMAQDAPKEDITFIYYRHIPFKNIGMLSFLWVILTC